MFSVLLGFDHHFKAYAFTTYCVTLGINAHNLSKLALPRQNICYRSADLRPGLIVIVV